MNPALGAILGNVEEAVAQGVDSIESTLGVEVNNVRNAAADAVAKAGVGAAAQIGAPGNKYDTIVKAVSGDWRLWLVLAGGIAFVVVLIAKQKR